MKGSLCVLALLFAQATLAVAPAAVAKPSDIRVFDFANAAYKDFCGVGAVRLRRGEFRRAESAGNPPIEAHLVGVKFGDVLHNGKTQALVDSWCSAGGAGIFSFVSVYALASDKLVKIADVANGDRSWGGILRSAVENGSIVVEQCLPEDLCRYSKLTTFRWDGKKFAALHVIKHLSGEQ